MKIIELLRTDKMWRRGSEKRFSKAVSEGGAVPEEWRQCRGADPQRKRKI